MFDDEIDELTDAQQQIAVARACRSVGIECEWAPDGHLIVYGSDLDENEVLVDAFTLEAYKILADLVMQDLLEEGSVKVSGVDDDGELMYSLADADA